MINVLVWNEYVHEKTEDAVKKYLSERNTQRDC